MVKILYAVRIGDEDWQEEIITVKEERIPAASEWALANGYDRLRVAEIGNERPDFTKVLNTGKSSKRGKR